MAIEYIPLPKVYLIEALAEERPVAPSTQIREGTFFRAIDTGEVSRYLNGVWVFQYTGTSGGGGSGPSQAEFDALETLAENHDSRHEDGGADEISVAGLSGALADAQTPTPHATSHESGGSDEINATGLLGVGFTPDFTLWLPQAPPASPGADDDEFDGSQGAGAPTGWVEFDPGSKVTVSEVESGLVLQALTSTGGDFIGGVYKAIPAGDFSIMAHISSAGLDSGLWWAALALFEDAAGAPTTSDIYTWGSLRGNNSMGLHSWSAYNAIASAFGTPGWGGAGITEAWYRIRRSGTTYAFDVSLHGSGWSRHFSQALTFVPAHYGLVINNRGSGGTATARFRHFRYVASDVGIEGQMSGDRVDMVRT